MSGGTAHMPVTGACTHSPTQVGGLQEAHCREEEQGTNIIFSSPSSGFCYTINGLKVTSFAHHNIGKRFNLKRLPDLNVWCPRYMDIHIYYIATL